MRANLQRPGRKTDCLESFESTQKRMPPSRGPPRLSPWAVTELAARRSRLLASIASSANHEGPITVVVRGADPVMQCGVPLPTRQKTHFRYLTGCTLPSSWLLLQGRDGRVERTRFFFDRRTKTEEIWDGPQPSDDDLRREHAFDEILPCSSLPVALDKAVSASGSLTVADPLELAPPAPEIVARGRLEELSPHLDRLRLIKSPAEVAAMERAAEVGGRALASAIMSGHEDTEAAFAARILLEYARAGAEGPAYPPVVAGGDRACTVHYLSLHGRLERGASVLVDAGADVDGYLSDISRCFPVSGHFSRAQRVLYDALETVQLTLVAEAQQGDVSLNRLFGAMNHLLAEALTEAGIFTRQLNLDEREAVISRLCPHHVGHYLGMDVHDSPSVSRGITMAPGTSFTIEPGIYVRPGDPDIKREFHGIGLRIEDDVIIDGDGRGRVLSHHCPKSIEDIEALVQIGKGR